jgi:hypothetical protein
MLWATAKYEVVGVLEDGKYGSLTENPQPAMFLPSMQGVGTHLPTRAMILVRSDQEEEQIAAALRHTLGNVEANVPFRSRRGMTR